MRIKKSVWLVLCLSVLTLTVSAQKTITILHTNDVHSRIEPMPTDNPDTLSAGKGGFLRIAAYVEQVRKETTNVLLFDSGDFSQGTPYYNEFKGEVEIKLMNAIGYDASIVGNHEFDSGMDNMARLFNMANFPILCANYDMTGTVLEGTTRPYIIIEKAGIKIGVLGLGTQLDGLVQEKLYGNVKYLDPYETGNKIAEELKKKHGCDLVICISHLGLKASAKNPTGDITLAEQSRYIDLILGGHSHTFMTAPQMVNNLDGKPVMITQTGKNGVFVDRVDLTIE